MIEVIIDPNWFAYLAIALWPLVAIVLFATRPVAQAAMWTIVGAQLLLPVGTVIKFPMVPALDKTSVPNLCAFIGCMIFRQGRPASTRLTTTVIVLIVANMIAPLCSVFENTAPIFVGARVLPAADLYNGGSAVISTFFFLIPFVIGRWMFSENDEIKEALKIFAIAGLIYSLPAMYELRFSPQLHAMFYGYYPSQYAQSLRGDGYRPMVLMGHGLVLTFFLAVSTLSAATLWKLRIKLASVSSGAIAAYLGLFLLVCRSFGATLYCVFLAPLILRVSQKLQIAIALVLVVFSLAYPLLRSQDLVPTSLLLDAAGTVSPDRARSLKVRFDNEDKLLARASERLLFGWGGYGRNRVYGEDYGNDTSLTDGRWILMMGNYGLLGFLAEFGLLAIGVFNASRAYRYARSFEDRVLLASLALIVAINIIELLPNSTLMPWTWLLAGALFGKTQALMSARRSRSAVKLESADRGLLQSR